MPICEPKISMLRVSLCLTYSFHHIIINMLTWPAPVRRVEKSAPPGDRPLYLLTIFPNNPTKSTKNRSGGLGSGPEKSALALSPHNLADRRVVEPQDVGTIFQGIAVFRWASRIRWLRISWSPLTTSLKYPPGPA